MQKCCFLLSASNMCKYTLRLSLQVGDGQVLLMDAGCEYHGYVSDVTRTWPVNGRYTAEQRQVYETVLEVRRR